MLKRIPGLIALLASIFSSIPVLAVTGHVNVYSYASGNVSTSAYTVLWASTPVSAGHLEICDTSGHMLKIATGATGSELDIASTAVSGCIIVSTYIPPGTQLNIKAIDASATTGYNVVSLQ